MNRENTLAARTASLVSVSGVFHEKGERRPLRSYRGPRRNLARAVSAATRLPWFESWAVAQKATAESMKPAPKPAPVALAPETFDDFAASFGEAPKQLISEDRAALESTIGEPEPRHYADATPSAPVPVKKARAPKKPKAEPASPPPPKPPASAPAAATEKPKAKRKPAAPKADPAPKAPTKAKAKATAPKAVKTPAAPRKRVVKPAAA